ncbi:hypothetical protein KL929_000917 [Ogataea haglerorum]|nr:hypothetical protein KL929_000917 [Ogataea haglerorum]
MPMDLSRHVRLVVRLGGYEFRQVLGEALLDADNQHELVEVFLGRRRHDRERVRLPEHVGAQKVDPAVRAGERSPPAGVVDFDADRVRHLLVPVRVQNGLKEHSAAAPEHAAADEHLAEPQRVLGGPDTERHRHILDPAQREAVVPHADDKHDGKQLVRHLEPLVQRRAAKRGGRGERDGREGSVGTPPLREPPPRDVVAAGVHVEQVERRVQHDQHEHHARDPAVVHLELPVGRAGKDEQRVVARSKQEAERQLGDGDDAGPVGDVDPALAPGASKHAVGQDGAVVDAAEHGYQQDVGGDGEDVDSDGQAQQQRVGGVLEPRKPRRARRLGRAGRHHERRDKVAARPLGKPVVAEARKKVREAPPADVEEQRPRKDAPPVPEQRVAVRGRELAVVQQRGDALVRGVVHLVAEHYGVVQHGQVRGGRGLKIVRGRVLVLLDEVGEVVLDQSLVLADVQHIAVGPGERQGVAAELLDAQQHRAQKRRTPAPALVREVVVSAVEAEVGGVVGYVETGGSLGAGDAARQNAGGQQQRQQQRKHE